MRDKNPVWPGIEPTSRLASAEIMTEGPFQSTPTLHSTFQQITRKHELTTRGREALWSHAAGYHDMLDLLNWDEKGGARLGKKCNIVLVRRLDTSSGNITHRESNVCINIRHKLSTIPYMQRILNEKEREKMKILRQVDKFSMPVNNSISLYKPHHWENKNLYYYYYYY